MAVVNFPLEYTPKAVTDIADVYNELQLVQRHLRELATNGLAFVQWTAAPAKAYDGMVVYADGATWNPGAGKGIYRYDGAAWNLLG